MPFVNREIYTARKIGIIAVKPCQGSFYKVHFIVHGGRKSQKHGNALLIYQFNIGMVAHIYTCYSAEFI